MLEKNRCEIRFETIPGSEKRFDQRLLSYLQDGKNSSTQQTPLRSSNKVDDVGDEKMPSK